MNRVLVPRVCHFLSNTISPIKFKKVWNIWQHILPYYAHPQIWNQKVENMSNNLDAYCHLFHETQWKKGDI